MSEIKINDCDYEEDTLTVNNSHGNKLYFGVIESYREESGVFIDLEGVNKLQQMIDDWKEINGYD